MASSSAQSYTPIPVLAYTVTVPTKAVIANVAQLHSAQESHASLGKRVTLVFLADV